MAVDNSDYSWVPKTKGGISENNDSGIAPFITHNAFFTKWAERYGRKLDEEQLSAFPMNDSAADFFPCISRRLRVEIIAHGMHNDRSS